MPREDAKIAFDRERRRRVLSKLAARLRFEPDDVSHMLPFDEVVAALGATSRVDLGEQVIPLESIVGTVDRRRGEFDRDFRPSPGTRGRWERIAEARKRGEAMPPIDVFRIGDLHFVRDGHHRVSVARALKEKDINARVTEVRTKLGADRELKMQDLPLKAHERVFHERVPLSREQRETIQLSDEWRYAQLATLVESWGYRASLARGQLLSRRDVAHLWYVESTSRSSKSCAKPASAAAAPRPSATCGSRLLRFLLLQTHDWTDEIAERLSSEVKSPSTASEQDTMTHQILKELRD